MDSKYDFRLARLYEVEKIIPRRMYVVDKFIEIANEYQELVLSRSCNNLESHNSKINKNIKEYHYVYQSIYLYLLALSEFYKGNYQQVGTTIEKHNEALIEITQKNIENNKNVEEDEQKNYLYQDLFNILKTIQNNYAVLESIKYSMLNHTFIYINNDVLINLLHIMAGLSMIISDCLHLDDAYYYVENDKYMEQNYQETLIAKIDFYKVYCNFNDNDNVIRITFGREYVLYNLLTNEIINPSRFLMVYFNYIIKSLMDFKYQLISICKLKKLHNGVINKAKKSNIKNPYEL